MLAILKHNGHNRHIVIFSYANIIKQHRFSSLLVVSVVTHLLTHRQ